MGVMRRFFGYIMIDDARIMEMWSTNEGGSLFFLFLYSANLSQRAGGIDPFIPSIARDCTLFYMWTYSVCSDGSEDLDKGKNLATCFGHHDYL